jgi:hypothetical protein
MSEEKKGHMKMTFELEMNKEFMEVMKEGMANMSKMHWKIPEMMKQSNEEK